LNIRWSHEARIRTALLQGLRQLYDADRDTLQLILQALGTGQDNPQPSFTDRVTVAACLAAAATAILTWVENNGTRELPHLIEQAFDTLSRLR
jgi:hypothetical protein